MLAVLLLWLSEAMAEALNSYALSLFCYSHFIHNLFSM